MVRVFILVSSAVRVSTKKYIRVAKIGLPVFRARAITGIYSLFNQRRRFAGPFKSHDFSHCRSRGGKLILKFELNLDFFLNSRQTIFEYSTFYGEELRF